MKKTIMVVDDVSENIQVLKSILEEGGYRVRAATNGERAIKLAGAEPHPNLVLLDVMMPGLDGYEVCQNLKANPTTEKIPVIFVTARGEVEDETHGFNVGAVDYISKPVSPPIVLARVRTHLSLVKVDELNALARASIQMLGEAGHYNDTDTGVHIWRMADYARAIALAVGWDPERAGMLQLAAALHDMGKIGVPDAILKAERRLEPEEWKIMQTHSLIGYNILSKSRNPVFSLAAEVALNHHEKWDGSGYPNGLQGEAIPQSARIAAIADVFDALTMNRPYKNAWAVEDAFLEIQKMAGAHLDPHCVKAFLEIKDLILRIKKKWDSVEAQE